MSRATQIRDAWHPQTPQDRESILLELHAILASPHFCNSKRYPALLQYVVEKTLAGDSESLKERTLGVEVFDRPPSYDTNADTVVRYTAGEVRKRLSLYYHELGHKAAIQISLPAGSYIPEFLPLSDGVEDSPIPRPRLLNESSPSHLEPEPIAQWGLTHTATHPEEHGQHSTVSTRSRAHRHRQIIPGAVAIAAIILLLAGLGWRYRTVNPKTPLASFWAPVLRDQSTITVCIGGSVFSQTHTSGVATASKDVDYPFISIQSASAVADISALLERNGEATTLLQAAATTPLTELREHPVILLGGYNNQWTLRMVQPLRFHLSPETAGETIVDTAHPGIHWQRDQTLPYSSADDYALVARFRDPDTDSWVVALAGIGRNGTEAAAQFATSPHYMQLLRESVGNDFASKNVEAVLKVSVIDGKTGAPAILATTTW